MLDKSYMRYKQLQTALETDQEYLYLHRVRLSMEPDFLDLLQKLPPEHGDLIREYLAVCGEIGERRVEYACQLP